MKIGLEIKGIYKELNINNSLLILGKNNTGKTNIINSIVDGLDGNDNHFMLNGMVAPKGVINYYHITCDRIINDELNAKSKTLVYKNYIKPIIDFSDDTIEELVKVYADGIESLLPDSIYESNDFMLKIDRTKTEKLSNIIFELFFDKTISSSTKELFYVHQVIEYCKQKNVSLLLYDNIDKEFDVEGIKNIMNLLNENNIQLIATSTNKFLLNNLNFNYVYDTYGNLIDIKKRSEIMFFESLIELEESSLTYDDYVTKNYELYQNSDLDMFYTKNKLKIIENIMI